MTNIQVQQPSKYDLSDESLANDFQQYDEFNFNNNLDQIDNFDLIEDFLFMRFEKPFGTYVPILSDHVEQTIGIKDHHIYLIERTDKSYFIKHQLDYRFFNISLTQKLNLENYEKGIYCLSLFNSLHKYEFLHESPLIISQVENQLLKYTIQSELKSKYNIEGMIGVGSQGKVFLATPKQQNQFNQEVQQVAIKAINKQKTIKQARTFEQLSNEIKMHQELSNCENIVKLLEIYQDNENIYLVLEYLERGSLTQRFSENISFSEDQVKFIMEQMLLATDFMHSKNIIHRDIKLDNILVGTIEEDHIEVKLADFGLAKQLDEQNDHTNEKCGTPGCIGPEVFNSKGYSFSADIFSLGSLFFNLLTSRYLFSGKTSDEIIRRNMECDLRHIRKYLIGISSDAQDVLYQLLEKDPRKRPSIKKILKHQWFQHDHPTIKSLLIQSYQLIQHNKKRGYSQLMKQSMTSLVQCDQDHKNLKFKKLIDKTTSLSLGYANANCQPYDSSILIKKNINFFKELRESRSNSSKRNQNEVINYGISFQSVPFQIQNIKSKFSKKYTLKEEGKSNYIANNDDRYSGFNDIYDKQVLEENEGNQFYNDFDNACDIEDCDINKDDQHNKLSTTQQYQLSNKMDNLNIVQIRRVFI